MPISQTSNVTSKTFVEDVFHYGKGLLVLSITTRYLTELVVTMILPSKNGGWNWWIFDFIVNRQISGFYEFTVSPSLSIKPDFKRTFYYSWYPICMFAWIMRWKKLHPRFRSLRILLLLMLNPQRPGLIFLNLNVQRANFAQCQLSVFKANNSKATVHFKHSTGS